MVFFNHATRQMTAKIVYYGPGLCGKTTNLNTIYAKTSQKARGEMVSLNTETDRTLFFDLLPLDVGTVGGFKTKLQLYTVPGQVFYNSTRKLVLKGVDGIVFVVDSQVPMLDANKESLQNLEENLRELGLDLRAIPMVFQWNKRDLKNVVPIEQLEAELNARAHPSFQSIAQEGVGVFETLRGVTRLALAHIKVHHLGDVSDAKPEPKPEPPAPKPQPAPEPPPARVPEPEPIRQETLPTSIVPPGAQPSDVTIKLPDKQAPAVMSAAQALSFLDMPPAGVPAAGADAEPQPEQLAPEPAAPAPAPVPVAASEPVAKPIAAPMQRPAVPAPPAAPGLKRPGLPAPPVPPAPKPPVPGVPRPGGALPAVPGAPAAPSLRVQIPQDCTEREVEVVVQVRVKGQVIAEAKTLKGNPGPGLPLKLALEIKRG